MLKTFVLHCDNCGAPLTISPGVDQITCPYCGSVLSIHRNDGVATTETLAALNRRAEQLADTIEVLRLNQTLMDLDRAWDREVESYKFRNRDGSGSLLGPEEAVLRSEPVLAPGLWMLFIALGLPFDGGLLFMGPISLLALAGGAFVVYRNLTKVWAYQQAVARYHAQRDKLRLQIAAIEDRLEGAEHASLDDVPAHKEKSSDRTGGAIDDKANLRVHRKMYHHIQLIP